MRKGGVRLQICTTNHLKIQILLEREKFNMEINILWLEVRLENVRLRISLKQGTCDVIHNFGL